MQITIKKEIYRDYDNKCEIDIHIKEELSWQEYNDIITAIKSIEMVLAPKIEQREDAAPDEEAD